MSDSPVQIVNLDDIQVPLPTQNPPQNLVNDYFNQIIERLILGHSIHERRHRAVPIGQSVVFELVMQSAQQNPEYLIKFHCKDLPAGYKVEYVLHDQYRQIFLFMVSHPSFDPVPEGCEAPLHQHPGTFAWTRQTITRSET